MSETTAETVVPAAPAPEAPQAAPAAAPVAAPVAAPAAEAPAAAAAETPKAPEADKPTEPQRRAPEAYEAFTGVQHNAEAVESFHKVARELDLSQADAQKLVDYQTQQTEAVRSGWLDASKADAEFGGDKLAENLGVASKALEAFGSPALNKMLIETGLGNHPEVIRTFYRMGKAISEDRVVTGGAPGPGRTLADRLYPQSH